MQSIATVLTTLKMEIYHGILEINATVDHSVVDMDTYHSQLARNMRYMVTRKVRNTSKTDQMKLLLEYGLKKAMKIAVQRGYDRSIGNQSGVLLHVLLMDLVIDVIDMDDYKIFKTDHDQSDCYCKNVVGGGTIVSGIKCKQCDTILPEHTVEQHLDISHPIHTCPHRK
jgi:hypothetical protein